MLKLTILNTFRGVCRGLALMSAAYLVVDILYGYPTVFNCMVIGGCAVIGWWQDKE